jgi:hypothetical protein
MTLKQLEDKERIVFLRKFTAELLISKIREYRKEQEIKIAKLKQKFIEPRPLPDQAFKKIIQTPIFESSEETKKREKIELQRIKQIKEIEEKKKTQKLKEISVKKSFIEKLRKPIFHRSKYQKPIPINQRQRFMAPKKQQIKQKTGMTGMQKSIQIPIQETKRHTIRKPLEDIKKIKPEAEQRPTGFSLGKIEKILRDKTIQSIECPGPGKKVLVKKLSKINSTSLTLGQPEITNIIQKFASQAKIPIMGGILKAAVGDMVISAVISEYVGSRFIINRLTPYSILQK